MGSTVDFFLSSRWGVISLGAPNRLVLEASLFVFQLFFSFLVLCVSISDWRWRLSSFFFSSTSEITFSFLYIYPPVRLVFFFYKNF